jgi:hypothetical protein
MKEVLTGIEEIVGPGTVKSISKKVVQQIALQLFRAAKTCVNISPAQDGLEFAHPDKQERTRKSHASSGVFINFSIDATVKLIGCKIRATWEYLSAEKDKAAASEQRSICSSDQSIHKCTYKNKRVGHIVVAQMNNAGADPLPQTLLGVVQNSSLMKQKNSP